MEPASGPDAMDSWMAEGARVRPSHDGLVGGDGTAMALRRSSVGLQRRWGRHGGGLPAAARRGAGGLPAACRLAARSSPMPMGCAATDDQCQYRVQYPDGSTLASTYIFDMLTLNPAKPAAAISEFRFGCTHMLKRP